MNTHYLKRTQKSGEAVIITTTDEVQLKCDCVDGSIVNGIKDQNLIHFQDNAPPRYEI